VKNTWRGDPKGKQVYYLTNINLIIANILATVAINCITLAV